MVEPFIDRLPAELSEASSCDFIGALLTADIHLLLVDHEIFKYQRPSRGKVIDTKGIWTDIK